MPKKGFKKKDKFASLPEEFKTAVAGGNEAEVRERIAKVTLDHAALMQAKEEDDDYKAKREEVKTAGAVYREGTKKHKLMVAFCRNRLGELGKPNGDA